MRFASVVIGSVYICIGLMPVLSPALAAGDTGGIKGIIKSDTGTAKSMPAVRQFKRGNRNPSDQG
jgi:hypothetical protein